MKRLVLIASIGIAIIGSGLTMPAQAIIANHQISGNFARESATPGFCLRYGISATTNSGNTSGSFSVVRYPCANGDPTRATGQVDSKMEGPVACLAVNGNQYVVAGPTTTATGAFAGALWWQNLGNDISSPSSPANPDTNGGQAFFAGSPTCASQGPIILPVKTGDLRIAY
jgi:hypothetical protein